MRFHPGVIAAAVGEFHLYLDSINGSDANDGRSAAQAKQTVATASSLLLAEQRLGLATGSHWREELASNAALSLVGSYGPADLPIIDGADILLPSDFMASAHGDAEGVVYEVSLSRDPGGVYRGDDRYLIWEDGEWLRRVASVAAAAETAGTFYPNPSIGASTTLYVHPFGSTDPRSDGKTYEAAIRSAAVEAYGNSQADRHDQTFEYLHTRQSLGHYGPFTAGLHSTVRRCLLARGGLHNAVIGSGLVEDSLVIDWDPDNANAIPLTFYAANPSGTDVVLRRTHFGHPGNPASRKGVYSHSSGGNPVHDNSLIEWCVGWPGDFISNAEVTRDIHDIATRHSRPITLYGAAPATTISRALCHMDNGFSQSIYNNSGSVLPLIENVGFVMDSGQGDGLMIPECTVFRRSTLAILSGTLGEFFHRDVGNIEDCIFIMNRSGSIFWNMGAGDTSDYNVYCDVAGATFFWRETSSGPNYSSLAAWQAATGRDLNSVRLNAAQTEDLFLNGVSGLSSGDFRLNPNCELLFPDGTPIIDRAGIREYSDFNNYTVKQGQPSKWPKPPVTEAEGVAYLKDPEAWDFYA